jgi:hypothetical protein
MRVALGVSLVVVSAACAATDPVDLGGDDAATPEAGAGAPSTMEIVTCTDSSTSATLGNGFNGERPAACDAPSGAASAVTSPDQMASLLVGLWDDCTHQSFGIDFGGAPTAVEFTSSGQYVGYGTDDNSTLVPLSSLPGASGSSSGSGGAAVTPSSTGNFTVVDGSATYGPGTYELQLRPGNGGLFSGQVVVTDDPRQIQYFAQNATEQVFTSPLPWSVREGVCSCIDATETATFQDDPVGLANAILGQWMWCGGNGPPLGNIGIEFAAGSTWYGLDEDASGTVTRDESALGHGTFQIVPTDSLNGPIMGPEPLTVTLSQATQFTFAQVLLFANPRVLLVGIGTTSAEGGPTEGVTNVYSTCFPMP